MTQGPVTVTYSLEEVLDKIIQKLDRMDEKSESFRKDVDDKFENLQKEIVEIKVGQVKLESELKGIGKRLDTQDFTAQSAVIK
ncbi:MAG: hypothetical protein F6K47_42355 [Symploca sp. SIO2E6]|nr:hypothetical protein [Symploca sp. SIO2E6]